MTSEPLRVYADTSVFGGVFDDEFRVASTAFFEQVRQGRFRLVTSAVVEDEIESAPEAVQLLLHELLPYTETIVVDAAAVHLQQAYLDANVVSARWAIDALHVALATASRCALIVSWNFKHIVHYQKIPLYNAVNTLEGHGSINIYSPHEVIGYEDEKI